MEPWLHTAITTPFLLKIHLLDLPQFTGGFIVQKTEQVCCVLSSGIIQMTNFSLFNLISFFFSSPYKTDNENIVALYKLCRFSKAWMLTFCH